MNPQKKTPAWLPGTSLGVGLGIGGAIGRGAGDSFSMKVLLGATAAALIALAAYYVLAGIYFRRRK